MTKTDRVVNLAMDLSTWTVLLMLIAAIAVAIFGGGS